jgi:hypothetical protein
VIDWGSGQYEQTAAELHPIAEHVIAAELEISAAAPEAYAARQSEHPMQIAAPATLEPVGVYDEVMERVATIRCQRNEDPAAFRVRSPYRIIRLRHAPA